MAREAMVPTDGPKLLEVLSDVWSVTGAREYPFLMGKGALLMP